MNFFHFCIARPAFNIDSSQHIILFIFFYRAAGQIMQQSVKNLLYLQMNRISLLLNLKSQELVNPTKNIEMIHKLRCINLFKLKNNFNTFYFLMTRLSVPLKLRTPHIYAFIFNCMYTVKKKKKISFNMLYKKLSILEYNNYQKKSVVNSFLNKCVSL